MTKKEIEALQKYLQQFLKGPVKLQERVKIKDSVEVYSGTHLLGLIYQDEDDDGSYTFSIPILPEDLSNDA